MTGTESNDPYEVKRRHTWRGHVKAAAIAAACGLAAYAFIHLLMWLLSGL